MRSMQLILNPPSAFTVAWRFIKPFLDQRTRNKIEVVRGRSSIHAKLHELIDPADIPDFLGGDCRCPGGCVSPGAPPSDDADDDDDDEEDPEKEVRC
mmetsp:Transcript_14258/g.30956  ORF Transcript_14258/g.30956 Transcript_14258/m.30956 type:complete len:97 (-) Transcript_14258:190-480(-)